MTCNMNSKTAALTAGEGGLQAPCALDVTEEAHAKEEHPHQMELIEVHAKFETAYLTFTSETSHLRHRLSIIIGSRPSIRKFIISIFSLLS